MPSGDPSTPGAPVAAGTGVSVGDPGTGVDFTLIVARVLYTFLNQLYLLVF